MSEIEPAVSFAEFEAGFAKVAEKFKWEAKEQVVSMLAVIDALHGQVITQESFLSILAYMGEVGRD